MTRSASVGLKSTFFRVKQKMVNFLKGGGLTNVLEKFASPHVSVKLLKPAISNRFQFLICLLLTGF